MAFNRIDLNTKMCRLDLKMGTSVSGSHIYTKSNQQRNRSTSGSFGDLPERFDVSLLDRQAIDARLFSADIGSRSRTKNFFNSSSLL